MSSPADAAAAQNGLDVLILDDDELVCSHLERVLEADGKGALSVASLTQAREAMKAVRFRLLIVDRRLGDGDGIELCREYRAQAPLGDTAILVLSSLDSAEHMAEALAAGADDCMSKSSSEQEFLAKVDRLLAKATQRVKPATMSGDAETRRLQALSTYRILDTEEEAIYDDIALLASRICNTPIAMVSFIDGERQWFKSKVGLAARQTPRDQAFCAYAIAASNELLIVNDARLDPRFAANPLVTGEPKIRFYAGAPIVTPDGDALGTLCVIDRQPRELDAIQQQGLQALSRQVMALLEARRLAATIHTAMQANLEAERLKDEFLTMVSHELRTPITALRGALGLLTAGAIADLPPKVHSLIALADRNADRLHRLVNDILDLKRIEAGAFDFRMAAVDMVELVAQAATELQPYADQYRVTLTVVAHSPQAIVLADADRLMQVLANLISNAIKFSPAGEQVEIHSTRIAKRVRISVTDRGGGISEEFRSRIFKKFAQAESTATNRKGGSGLGLNISQTIVERHGGELKFLTSTGDGTTFYFELPARPDLAATATDHRAHAISSPASSMMSAGTSK